MAHPTRKGPASTDDLIDRLVRGVLAARAGKSPEGRPGDGPGRGRGSSGGDAGGPVRPGEPLRGGDLRHPPYPGPTPKPRPKRRPTVPALLSIELGRRLFPSRP